MATPSGSGINNKDIFDPTSPKFDPMRALYSRTANIPVPEAKQFNNLAEFENFLKGKDAKTLKQKSEAKPKRKRSAKPKRNVDDERADAKQHELERKEAILAKNAGPATPAEKTKVRRNTDVLKRMSQYQKGPLSLLRRCVEERLRVVIVVRAAVAVRSHCRGYVVAFDKHLNMALMDVDEKFIRPRVVDKASKKTSPEPDVGLAAETERLNLKSDSESEKPGMSEDTHRMAVSSKQVHKTSREVKHTGQIIDLRTKLKSESEKPGMSEDKHIMAVSSKQVHKTSREVKHTGQNVDLRTKLKSESEKPGMSEDKHIMAVSSKQVHKTSREVKHTGQVVDLRAKLKSKSHSKQFDDRGGTMSDSSEVKVKTKCRVNRKSKSDVDSVSEHSDVEAIEGRSSSSKGTRICYQPFWPLYMKWAENRCHASYEVVTRHVNQLFIRGDNVVSVSIAQ